MYLLDDDRQEDPAHLGGWLVAEEQEGSEWAEGGRCSFDPLVTPESLRSDNILLTSGVAYPRALHDDLEPFDARMGNY